MSHNCTVLRGIDKLIHDVSSTTRYHQRKKKLSVSQKYAFIRLPIAVQHSTDTRCPKYNNTKLISYSPHSGLIKLRDPQNRTNIMYINIQRETDFTLIWGEVHRLSHTWPFDQLVFQVHKMILQIIEFEFGKSAMLAIQDPNCYAVLVWERAYRNKELRTRLEADGFKINAEIPMKQYTTKIRSDRVSQDDVISTSTYMCREPRLLRKNPAIIPALHRVLQGPLKFGTDPDTAETTLSDEMTCVTYRNRSFVITCDDEEARAEVICFGNESPGFSTPLRQWAATTFGIVILDHPCIPNPESEAIVVSVCVVAPFFRQRGKKLKFEARGVHLCRFTPHSKLRQPDFPGITPGIWKKAKRVFLAQKS